MESINRAVRQAKRTIEINAFVWRKDTIGTLVADELHRAASRGVKVSIQKSLVGALWELVEEGGQSLLHQRYRRSDLLRAWLLSFTNPYSRDNTTPTTKERHGLLTNPRVNIRVQKGLVNHSKTILVDNNRLFLGSMGLGDDFGAKKLDLLVEVCGVHAKRYLQRRITSQLSGPEAPVDFIVQHPRRNQQAILDFRTGAISGARIRIQAEAAYFDDPRIARLLILAANRGVQVDILTSRQANALQNSNVRTCNRLLRCTANGKNLRVFLHDKMVHSKALVIDGRIAEIGSANFTTLSHFCHGETEVVLRGRRTVEKLSRLLDARLADGVRVRKEMDYDPGIAFLERLYAWLQSR